MRILVMASVYQDGEYFETRFPYDEEKNVVWNVIGDFLDSRYGVDGTVVDVGAGYGYFLNGVNGSEKIGIDYSMYPLRQETGEFKRLVGDATQIPLSDNTADTLMASNVLEHLSVSDIQSALAEFRRVLAADGTLFIVTPNFALAPRQYYDDFTHETPLTHQSVSDLLTLSGFEERDRIVRFLPFSAKSNFPVIPSLIRVYLSLPWVPFAGQSLFVAEPVDY